MVKVMLPNKILLSQLVCKCQTLMLTSIPWKWVSKMMMTTPLKKFNICKRWRLRNKSEKSNSTKRFRKKIDLKMKERWKPKRHCKSGNNKGKRKSVREECRISRRQMHSPQRMPRKALTHGNALEKIVKWIKAIISEGKMLVVWDKPW